MDLTEFRSQYPQYDKVDDDTLVKKLHEKYYADKLSLDDFKSKFVPPPAAPVEVVPPTEEKGVVGRVVDHLRDYSNSVGMNVENQAQSILEAPHLVASLGEDTDAPELKDAGSQIIEGVKQVAHAKSGSDVLGGVVGIGHGLGSTARRAMQDIFKPGGFGDNAITQVGRKIVGVAGDSAVNTATSKWFADKQKEAQDAMSPEFREAITKEAVSQDEDGTYHAGAGLTDPNWWINGGIQMGTQLPLMMGPSVWGARVSYGLAKREALAYAAAKGAPQSVALRYADQVAAKAGEKGAMLAGGLSEGVLSGAQDAQQTEDTINQIDEESLLHYDPYRKLREQGMSHEQARAIVAKQKALAVGIASAAVVGLTGAPLNAWIGKWATVGLKAGIAKRALAGAGMEAGQETVQGAGEQLIQNYETKDVDPNVHMMDQVINQAVSGGLIAGVFGGAEGAFSGHGKDMTTDLKPLRAAQAQYEKTQANLNAVENQARDPGVKIKFADLQAARDEHKASTLAMAQAMINTGQLDDKTQKSLASLLTAAQANGDDVPAPPGPPPGGPPAGPAGGGKTSQGVKVPLSGEEQAHHDALDAIATAQPVEPATLHALVAAGLAKVSSEGQPVLLPEGRRQRKALGNRIAQADEANAEASSSQVEEKPAAAAAQPAKTKPLAAKKRTTPKATVTPAVAVREMTDKEPTQDELDAAEARVKVAEVAGHGEGLGIMAEAMKKAKAERRQRSINEPNENARAAAANYLAEAGIAKEPVDTTTPVDEARGKRIADAYQAMEHNPNDPKVKEAYSKLAEETLRQYQHIKKTGLKVSFMKPGQKDPYDGNPRGAIEDVRDNNHMWVYPTESGFGNGTPEAEAAKKDNPMLAMTGERAGKHKLLLNDVFRVVHDYFGHVQNGNGFRANGEEAAWRAHSAMYSPLARAAMTSETRGQNSWVNFGPHGKANRTATQENTIYAPQKIGLLPEEFYSDKPMPPGEPMVRRSMAAKRQALLKKAAPKTMRFRHFSPHKADRFMLNPARMGSGVRGAESERGGPKVTALYAEHGPIEPEFHGMNEYHVDVPASDMYDANEDPLNLAAKSTIPMSFRLDDKGKMVPGQSQFDFSKYEEQIRKAGYRGYHMPKGDGILRGQARLFDRHEAVSARPAAAPRQAMAAVKNPKTQMQIDEALRKVAGLLTPQEKASLNRSTAKKLVDLFDELPDEKDLAAAAIAGQAKRGWYQRSAKAISNVFGPDAPRFAALLAALSPQTSVQQNLQNAVAVWAAWDKAGRPTDKAAIVKVMKASVFPGNNRLKEVKLLHAWVPNSIRALQTESPDTLMLSGPKVDSFSANLRGETNRVTLDAWMANFAHVNQTMFSGSLTKSSPGTRPGYLAYTARVRQAAEHLTKMTGETWTPAEVQETIWSWAKTLYEKTSEFKGLGTAQDILNDGEITDELINATPDFVTQFTDDPLVEKALRQAGYGQRLDELIGQEDSAGDGREKVAPLKGDSTRLNRAAGRLDAVRVDRNAAAAEKAARGGKRQAMASVSRVAMKPLLAPNGKPSKLSPEQHKQVRTAAFKKWFGDWEKFATTPSGVWGDASKEVSKVVDTETGEPLVVYHATRRAGFREFDMAEAARTHGSQAMFFAADIHTANSYAGNRVPEATLAEPGDAYPDTRPGYYPVFLNIRDPHEDHFEGANWDGQRGGMLSVISTNADGENEVQYNAQGIGHFRDRDGAYALALKTGGEVVPSEDHIGTTNDVVAEAQRFGNDGAIARQVIDTGQYGDDTDPTDVFAVFNPTQIKSATQNIGTFHPGIADIALAVASPSPIFYSRLIQAAQNLSLKSASADQWLATLKNQAGVRQEEIDYMDLPEWLAAHTASEGKVSKEDLLAYMNAMQLQIQETTLNSEDANAEGNGGSNVRYEGYQTPGGSKYRELLIQLPGGMKSVYAGAGFQTAHYQNDPNIIAHVRMNERTSADGKRTLFVEEVQSDWHQIGRRKGYHTADDVIENQRAQDEVGMKIRRLGDERDIIRERGLSAWANTTKVDSKDADRIADIDEELKVLDARVRALEDARPNGVPDAPFKTTWPELAMKRMIRYAAENGFHQIAWTTGDMQNERYNLAKHIREIRYVPQTTDIEGDPLTEEQMREQPAFIVTVQDIHGVDVIDAERMTPEKVEATLGKDIAQKMTNGEGDLPKSKLHSKRARVISGDGLKVGGGGMKGFYDKILPATVNKYVKKWGAQVGTTSIQTNEPMGITESSSMPGTFYVTQGSIISEPLSREAAQRWINKHPERMAETSVHALELNDKMQEAAMEGQPLFAMQPAPFETQQDANHREVVSAAAEVADKLGVTIQVVKTQDELPEEGRAYDGAGAVTGLFVSDPTEPLGGRLYLVSSHINSREEAVEVALHEAVGHMGVRALLGDNYVLVMEALSKSFPEQMKAAARQNGIDLNHPNQYTAMANRWAATEEMIAYAAGALLTKPDTRSVWQKIMAFVRKHLRMELAGKSLLKENHTEADLNRLIYAARDFTIKANKAKLKATRVYEGQVRAAMRDDTATPTLSTDNPGGQWLKDKIKDSLEDGKNEHGTPRRMGTVTGSFSGSVMIPVGKLARVPGMMGEQSHVRQDSLAWLKNHMNRTGKLPLMTGSSKQYSPFIMVGHDGKAYVNEGNHRIMAAKALGWAHLPVEVRYFNGGETAPGPFNPQTLLAEDAAARAPQQRVAMASKKGRPLGSAPGNVHLDSFLNKVGSDPTPLKDKWKRFKSTIRDRIAMAAFDHFHGIVRAANLAGVSLSDAGYFSSRMSGNSAELVQSMMEFGHPVWNGGAPDVAGNMGFLDILKPLGNNVNMWLAYMVARRAQRLSGEGRENLFEPQEIQAALDLAKQHPEFVKVADRYAEFQKKVLDFAQEAGIIDPDSRALWENQDYIPFYRLVENGQVQQHASGGKGLGRIKNQIVKLKGGKANLGDPMENIVRNWLALMDASLKAVAARSVADGLDGTGLVTKLTYANTKGAPVTHQVTPAHTIKDFIQNNPALVASLKAVGVDVNKLTPAQLRGLQNQLAVPPPAEDGAITVWRNGKREHWMVHDEMLFQSLQGISAKSWGPLMELLRAPKRWLTATVTITPQFLVKNVWRDMWHTFIIGTHEGKTITPIIDTIKGTIDSMKMDAAAQSMLAGGGSFAHGWIYGGDTAGGAAAIRRTMKAHHTGKSVVLDTPLKLFRFYRKLQNASENANRVAIYKKALASGRTRLEALYEARDILDFNMRGNNAVLRFMAESVPFLNARLQGLYRLGRGVTKATAAGVFLRGALLAAMSLALLARNWDDDRYKALSNDQKSNYWHMWDVFSTGDHWQIPKPFETGAVFGTIPEVMGDAFLTNQDEPDRAAQAANLVAYTFGQQLNLSPQPALIWPMIELATNKNSYTGAPVLTQGDQGVLPEDQVGPNSSPTYRALAQAMPGFAPEALRSPKQLEFLARAYMGNVQDYVLLATDKIVRSINNEPATPRATSGDWPGLRDFRKQGPATHTKYMDSMYEVADQAEKIYQSLNKARAAGTDEGDARGDELEDTQSQYLDVRADFQKASQQVTDLKKQQREIQLDPDMDPDEKRAQIDTIQEDINDIAADMWDLRPGGKLNPAVGAQLLTTPPEKQPEVLRKAGLPATADLLQQSQSAQ